MRWHVDDLDRDVDTLTPAVGGLQWGFNVPGAFVLVRVLRHGRVYVERDLKFKNLSVPDVVVSLKKLISDRCLPKRPSIFADPNLFAPVEPKEGVMVEPIASIFAREGLPLVQSHGDPMHGWQRVNDYLREAPDGKPWLIVSPKCQTLIRTLPTIEQKATDPETPQGEVYAAHALRLVLNSRPSVSALARETTKHAWGTLGWLKTRDSKPRGTLALD